MYILQQFLTDLSQGRAKEKVEHVNAFKAR